ncbi:hypothetical protein MLD38_011580 [Melastoma candidum]|uniref:Uncharacterized protein n=1 Tax=Melastoma candidum TaxID=119954 RepID=A0ACB9R3H5_9MYRT|nr:hypothetical protein MLD38_011580 [Melastoma candidum]
MAKRELSSTLRNLKFMQRAANPEGKAVQKDKEDAQEVKSEADDGNFVSSDSLTKRCVVIVEGDPHPGAVIGRMSFQSFNPSVDKMNGITPDDTQTDTEPEVPSISAAAAQREKASLRKNPMAMNEEDSMDFREPKSGGSGDLKRKQSPVAGETHYPNKSPRNGVSNQGSAGAKDRSSNKRSKKDKLDWNILRPSKGKSNDKESIELQPFSRY